MINVLFVCLGNICRSPSAEAVMNKIVEDEGYSDLIKTDSAGILDYHEGEKADQRMQKHAEKRGITLTSVSRPVKIIDFRKFDYIIGMDDQNIHDLMSIAPDDESKKKIKKMMEFGSGKFNLPTVPDPYYGGEAGFELVLDLLDDTCHGLLEYLKKEHPDKFNA